MMDRSVYCGSRPSFLDRLLPVLEKCNLQLVKPSENNL